VFFMALMFFISGLFVPSGLERKGGRRFFLDRARRLGVPFLLAVTLLMPLAYYASWRLGNRAVPFLPDFFRPERWPVGPPWFLWVLLLFCGVVAMLPRVPAWKPRCSWTLAAGVLAVTLLTVVPLRFFVGPYAWFSLGGPLDFQTSRLLVYFAWFLLGAMLRSVPAEKLRPWPLWLAIGLAGFCANWVLTGRDVLQGVAFSFCCTFTGLGSLGAARWLFRRAWKWADSLSANAYGIYIVHYVFITWMQYSLLPAAWHPALKFTPVFVVALAASWAATAAYRHVARRSASAIGREPDVAHASACRVDTRVDAR